MRVRLDPGESDLVETHEINVTPFIDIILVLLIIFMIAAPLATVDVPVDLPTTNTQARSRPDKPMFVTLKADLSLTVGEESVAREALGTALDQTSGGDKDQRVYLRADKTVAYGDLMRAMNALRTAGYLKLALVGLDSGAPQ